MLIWALIVLGGVLLLFGLDRLGLWMESRGWIYYRKKKPQPGGLGNALLELHTLLQPSREHIVEIKKAVRRQEFKRADPPKPGRDH